MDERGQRGGTLLETAIAVAIVAVVTGAVLGGMAMAAGQDGRSTLRGELRDAAARELAIAADVVKYQGARLAPLTIATSVPLPSGTPLPVQMTLQSTTTAAGAAGVSITVSAAGIAQDVTLSAAIGARAPLPGSTLHAPGLVPAPTGAP